jgi:hypothetical protein
MDSVGKFLVHELAYHYHYTAHKKADGAHTVGDVLNHALKGVDHNIRRLKMSLAQSKDNEDPHKDGQRNMLRVQQNHRELIKELLGHSWNDFDLLFECQRRLIEAERDYEQIARYGYSPHSVYANRWWDALNRMEYLGFLNRQLISVIDGN